MTSKTRLLGQAVFLGPVHLGLILLDRYAFRHRNPLLGIPRTIPELFQPPDRLFRLLREHDRVPPDARFLSCEHDGGADTEPDKNVARVEIVYARPGSDPESMPIFVKLPTARRYPAAFKALLASTMIDAKEVAFHNVVFPELARQAGGRENLGFAVPTNLFATWSRSFERSILVQECVDMDRYHSRPDWMNADASMVRRIVDSATDLHRRTWQLRSVPPGVLDRFLERRGVDWLDGGIGPVLLAAPSSFRQIWRAIRRRAAREPVTISHGDCRLGNCLFSADYSDVILTDWEVNSITYYLWDVSYCMVCSFTPEDRRAHERDVLRRYLDAIREDPANEDVPSLESALEMHRISMVVIHFFSGLIALFGGVGESQGNSSEDMRSWNAKLEAAMADALEDEEAFATSLDLPVSVVRRFREDYAALLARWRRRYGL